MEGKFSVIEIVPKNMSQFAEILLNIS